MNTTTTDSSLIVPALEGIQMDGTSFALFDPNFSTESGTRFDLQFKTSSQDGLLLFLNDFKTSDSLTIEMVSGQIHARIACSQLVTSVQSASSPRKNISDNCWHCLTVEFSPSKLSIKVDMDVFRKIEPKLRGLTLRGSLFIAGFPDHLNPSHTAVRSKSFWKGGIRALRVNGAQVNWFVAEQSTAIPASPDLHDVQFDLGGKTAAGSIVQAKMNLF